MTLQEKLDLEIPTKEEDTAVVHLYKEGIYADYQYSACLMKRYIKPDIQLMRKTRKNGFSYLRVGLPVGSKTLEPYIRFDETGNPAQRLDILLEHGLGLTFVLEECEVDIELGKKESDSAPLEKGDSERKVLEELRGLNLAELSPMMALSGFANETSMGMNML